MEGANQSVNFWDFWVLGSKFTEFLSVLKQQIKFCINLQCHETQLLCTFLAENLYTFNKRSLSRYKFGEIESLKFGTLMGSLRQNNIKFQLKKYRRVISHERSLKKKWLVVSNMTWGILWIFTQPLKSSKILLQWAIFVQSIWGLS